MKNYSHFIYFIICILIIENSDPVTISVVSDIKDSYSSTSQFQHENFRKQNKYLGTSKNKELKESSRFTDNETVLP